MPSLKDLRNRIASVKATQKITKAMQMVAAAKLRRAQMAAEAARPYAERMDKVLTNLSASIGMSGQVPTILGGGGGNVQLLVVCTAERGLCGAFNSSIARLAREAAVSLMGQGKTVKILCVGKKGHDVLRRQFGRQIIEVIDLRAVRALGFSDADAIGRKIVALHALLENAASEQGARMSAMDSASRNAGEMIKKQTMKYNRSRQAMITKELIEIISGAEALRPSIECEDVTM